MAVAKSNADADALERAQEIVYDAWEAQGSRRIKLARKALDICDDCADAYVILAEQVGSLHEARALYTEGLRAGIRAIGEDAFDSEAGNFWLDIEKRPYMRALFGLAVTLWELGKHEDAVTHASELLRLNPNDNQGARFLLVNWLQIIREEEQLSLLIRAFADDTSALVAYPRALLAFSCHGDSENARAALKTAYKRNAFVPSLLIGSAKLPRYDPDTFSRGSEEEAIIYARQGKPAWNAVDGALDWLASLKR